MTRLATLIFSCFLLSFASVHSQNALAFTTIGNNTSVVTGLLGPWGNSPRTVEAWIKTSTANTSMVIADWGNLQPGGRFTFGIVNGFLNIDINGGSVSSTVPVADGNWHYVAVTYAAWSVTYCLYIDGQQNTCGVMNQVMNTGPGAPLHLGTRVDLTNYYNGVMDEFRIWTIDRSPAEIAANWNRELCVLPGHLQAYYKFNQGIANGNNTGLDTLIDATLNGFLGDLNMFSLVGNISNWVDGAPLLTGLPSQTIADTTCDSYTSPSGNHVWTSSGTYQDTIFSQTACDSAFVVNLTVVSPDTSVTAAATSLTSNAMGSIYQWLDCNNAFSTIPGATNATYSPTQSGSYAVAVTQSGCTDTSGCYSVTLVGMSPTFSDERFRISPNPARAATRIRFSEPGLRTVYLFDNLGKLIAKKKISAESVQLEIPAAGTYYIRIENGEQSWVKKVIGL